MTNTKVNHACDKRYTRHTSASAHHARDKRDTRHTSASAHHPRDKRDRHTSASAHLRQKGRYKLMAMLLIVRTEYLPSPNSKNKNVHKNFNEV